MRIKSLLSRDDIGGYLGRNDAYEGFFGFETSRYFFCRLSVWFIVTVKGR